MNDYVDEAWYVDEEGRPHHFVVLQDDDPWNPRTEDDGNLGHMMCWYGHYELGDYDERKHYGDPYEFLWELMDNNSSKDDEDIQLMSVPQILRFLERKGDFFLPLAVYEHGGITMWCGSRWNHYDAQWDCSDIGWIYTTKDEILKSGTTFQGKRKRIKVTERNWRKAADEILRAEVKTYDQYLTGEVYGFRDYIMDEDGEDGEQYDSCWGYYYDYSSDLAEKMMDEVTTQPAMSEDEVIKAGEEYYEELAVMSQCDYLIAV